MVEEELPSVEAKQKERDALAKAMEEFLSAVERCRRSNPTWWPIRRRSRTASTAAAPSDFAPSQGPPPARDGGPCAMAPVTLTGISPRRIPVGEPIFRLFRHGWRRAKAFSFPVAALPFHIVNRSCLPSRRSKRRPGLPESEL